MVVLIFAFVLLIVLFFTNYPSSGRAQVTVPEELDLNSVRDALMEKLNWSRERAEAARTEYIRFLTLLKSKPGFMLVPWPNREGQDDLDQFWHQHILDTAKYAADCDRLFGRMIHHYPHMVRGSGQAADAVEKTQRLYARTFGEGSYGSSVDAAMLTGCGACGTVDAPSSSHTGDGGGSHSCGGHGCGGHGCGGGCGGH